MTADERSRSPRSPRSPGSWRGARSRRSVVRAAAWSVPIVSVATAPPARAAVSDTDALAVQLAEYYVHPWPEGTFGVVPRITLSNPRSVRAVYVHVQLTFPVASFTGTDDESDPPAPGFDHFVAIGDWSCGYTVPRPGDTDVYVQLYPDQGIAATGASTVGTVAQPADPPSLDWRNLAWQASGAPAPSIPLQVATWFAGESVPVYTFASLTPVEPPGT